MKKKAPKRNPFAEMTPAIGKGKGPKKGKAMKPPIGVKGLKKKGY